MIPTIKQINTFKSLLGPQANRKQTIPFSIILRNKTRLRYIRYHQMITNGIRRKYIMLYMFLFYVGISFCFAIITPANTNLHVPLMYKKY